MAEWKNIFVFGYGESQLVAPDKNGKTANAALSTLEPLLSYLATLQQEGTEISLQNLYSLNIFNTYFIDFLPNNKVQNKAQRFPMEGLDMSYITALANELATLVPDKALPPVFSRMTQILNDIPTPDGNLVFRNR